MHIIRTYRRYPLGRVGTLVLMLGFSLAACGVSAGASVAGTLTTGTGITPTRATGTIAGNVAAGPTCPVEQAENPCPNKPVTDRQVDILASSSATAGATPQPGNVVASTKTDANGNFSVNVPPGQYVVRVTAGPGMLGLRQETPGDVTVVANQTTTIAIVLDTGIR
jgi:hypothetical protein